MKQKIVIRDTNESEEARKQVCLEQLTQDRQQLLLRWPFIGSVIMRMELIPVRDDRLNTACTDGDNIFVDINFYAKLTKDERLFVLAHEVWHSILLHFARRQNREHDRFNIAADLEIHFTLAEENMQEPFVLPHDPQWKGLSAEEIYEKLPDFPKEQAQNRNHAGGNSDTASKGKSDNAFGDGQKSFDKHIYKDDHLPEEPSSCHGDSQNSDGESDQQSDQPGQGNHPSRGNQKQQDGNGQQNGENACPLPEVQASNGEMVFDKDYTPNVTKENVEHSRARTIAAAQQVERTQGKLPAGIQEILNKLQKPSLPWHEMLKQFVTTCYGGKRRWLPPARRHVWQDLYLPSMRDDVLKAVVALDTSGSTHGDLPLFFSEIFSLMKSFGKFELDVIQCDTKVQNVEHYSEANLPPPNKKWKTAGGGGTDFRPVFEYIQTKIHEQPNLLLFLTDGYGTAPKHRPAYPVMWVLTVDGHKPADWGHIIHFKKE